MCVCMNKHTHAPFLLHCKLASLDLGNICSHLHHHEMIFLVKYWDSNGKFIDAALQYLAMVEFPFLNFYTALPYSVSQMTHHPHTNLENYSRETPQGYKEIVPKVAKQSTCLLQQVTMPGCKKFHYRTLKSHFYACAYINSSWNDLWTSIP